MYSSIKTFKVVQGSIAGLFCKWQERKESQKNESLRPHTSQSAVKAQPYVQHSRHPSSGFDTVGTHAIVASSLSLEESQAHTHTFIEKYAALNPQTLKLQPSTKTSVYMYLHMHWLLSLVNTWKSGLLAAFIAPPFTPRPNHRQTETHLTTWDTQYGKTDDGKSQHSSGFGSPTQRTSNFRDLRLGTWMKLSQSHGRSCRHNGEKRKVGVLFPCSIIHLINFLAVVSRFSIL